MNPICIITKYYWDNKIKDDYMGRVYGQIRFATQMHRAIYWGTLNFGDKLEDLNVVGKRVQHDRQWMYKVRSRRARETIVALEN